MGILVFLCFASVLTYLTVVIFIFVPFVRLIVLKSNPKIAYIIILLGSILFTTIAQIIFLNGMGNTFKCYMNTCNDDAYWKIIVGFLPISFIYYVPSMFMLLLSYLIESVSKDSSNNNEIAKNDQV